MICIKGLQQLIIYTNPFSSMQVSLFIFLVLVVTSIAFIYRELTSDYSRKRKSNKKGGWGWGGLRYMNNLEGNWKWKTNHDLQLYKKGE